MEKKTEIIMRSDYVRYIRLANISLNQWATYFHNNIEGKDVETIDKYDLADKLELHIIPAVVHIAFCIEGFCNHWASFFHPLKKQIFLYEKNTSDNRSFSDSELTEMKELTEQVLTESMYGQLHPKIRDKISHLLLFFFNNICDKNFQNIEEIPDTYMIDCIQGYSICGVNEIIQSLVMITSLRNRLAHSSPYIIETKESNSTDHRLDHLKKILNVSYLDAISTEEMVNRTKKCLLELYNALDGFNAFTSMITEIPFLFKIPSIRIFDPSHPTFSFLPTYKKITVIECPKTKKQKTAFKKQIKDTLLINADYLLCSVGLHESLINLTQINTSNFAKDGKLVPLQPRLYHDLAEEFDIEDDSRYFAPAKIPD